MNLIGTKSVEQSKLLHEAHILAEYLDNDKDGKVDDPKVLKNMLKRKATLCIQRKRWIRPEEVIFKKTPQYKLRTKLPRGKHKLLKGLKIEFY
jgi:hypothetical protein